ncbi:MAG TPA: choice-of-anchor D domain-containing protein, partial [Mycobacteriales bacterium]|nr:choice-of-anchor D domain-containing protein [Mycobacteriales bacterium]
VGSGTTSSTVVTGSWFGKVFLTTSGPTASAASGWIDITGNLPAWSAGASTGNAWISGVAVNPLDSAEAWVTIGTASASRVFHTHTATTASPAPTWTDISTTLPAGLIVDSILVDPIKPQNLYIGTDPGALICTTCADPSLVANWAPLGTGLPNVRVDMLTLTADAADIVGWTHGRGAWYLPVPVVRPGAALTPSSVAYADQIVGTTSAPQDLTLTNNGGAPLTITSITLSGDFQRVSVGTGDCGAALAPGSSCTIRVTFTPSAVGSRSGTVTVNDNAANSPQTASLSGNGVPPPGGKYNPVSPKRILDTRYGPLPVGWSSAAPLGPGGSLDVQVADGT